MQWTFPAILKYYQTMTSQLKDRLIFLADKYENATFPDADPCQFLHWYDAGRDGVANVECAAFIAAMLAFGNRKQFIPKIQEILERAGEWATQFQGDRPEGKTSAPVCKCSAPVSQGPAPVAKTPAPECQVTATAGQSLAPECQSLSPAPRPSLVSYLQADAPNFPHGSQKFYRFYSYDDLHQLFAELAQVTRTYGSLGNAVQKIQEGKVFPSLQPAARADASVRLSSATPSSGGHPRNAPAPSSQPDPTTTSFPSATPTPDLATALSSLFPKSAIVPKGKSSANKRIYMFLRWMVRRNSPVDLGLWTWANPADLLIPLDVHVMEEAVTLGLLPPTARSNHKTAVELTKILAEVFPGDPARGDFALFGLGVDKGF